MRKEENSVEKRNEVIVKAGKMVSGIIGTITSVILAVLSGLDIGLVIALGVVGAIFGVNSFLIILRIILYIMYMKYKKED